MDTTDFASNNFQNHESMFNPNFLQMTRESLAYDLEMKVKNLEDQYQEETNLGKKLEIRIRQFSVATILTESYLMDPTMLIQAKKKLAEEYRSQNYLIQSYHHSIEALNKFKIYQSVIKNDILVNELYANLCESCFVNGSFREGLYYIKEFGRRSSEEQTFWPAGEGLSFRLKILFIHAKTLYKIGEFKDSESILFKFMENLEQTKIEMNVNATKGNPETAEIQLQLFLYQTEAYHHLQKISRKEGKLMQSKDYIKDILKCCDTHDRNFAEKNNIFRIKVKFSLLFLKSLEKLSHSSCLPSKRTSKPNQNYYDFLSPFIGYLSKTLENELGLLDYIKNESTFEKLMTMLKNQLVHFQTEGNRLELLRIVSILSRILKYTDEKPSFQNCAYFLLNEMLKIEQEKIWSEEWKSQVKGELRIVQKIARIVKSSFIKNISKSLYNELENVKEISLNDKTIISILGICKTNIGSIIDKITTGSL